MKVSFRVEGEKEAIKSIGFFSFRRASSRRRRKAFGRAAASVLTDIQLRTQKGRGLKGAFNGYTLSTLLQKIKKGQQTRPVNLSDTNLMLDNMKSNGRPRFGTVFFGSRGSTKKAFHTDQKRPWFGMKKEEVDKAMEVFSGSIFGRK